jgi:glycosyltransferase involved in cell wall biosynthesis
MQALVVLPTFQEADNITSTLKALRCAVPSGHILVVDDSSPDGTADLAKAAGATLGHIDVIVRPKKLGLGTAYRSGFRWGIDRGYDTLIEMDSDGSHNPAEIARLIAAVGGGADLAVGSRYVPGGTIPDWRFRRRQLSLWGNRYAAWVLRLRMTDSTSGFRAFRASAVDAIDLTSVRAGGYGFQIEMAYRVSRSGGRIVEVPISFTDRTLGHSKMSGRIIVEALLLVSWWGARDAVRDGVRRLSSRRVVRPGAV